jgi:diguanylate cyclase (GGDEF)-like protein
VLYLDLDQFKIVNDACGHAVGDELLKQLAQMFRTLVRSRDTLARMGGDEFGMILEQCSSSQALRVAQQIYERMDAFRFEHDGRRFRIGASIGLVQVDGDSGDLAAVIKAADAACYAAKEAGRNRVHVWNEGDRAIRERSGDMAWATRITQALDDDRFVLYVQPILPLGGSTESGGWNGEALVRMLNSDGSLAPPGAFLPAAERFGLAPRLDQWVVRESIRWLSEGERAEQVASLHVNLSACSLADTNFCDALLTELADLAPRLCAKLCFEITETVAIANLTEVASFVNGLRELGACVALDDFGAGASHFGYLKSLKVDIIKVDGQFIKGMLQDPVDDVSVRGFLEVARVLGVRTVAEFVDSEAVLERVRELGFDFAQGYFLGRPEPMADLAAAIA